MSKYRVKDVSRTRPRGLKRKCRNLVRLIKEGTSTFPSSPNDCDFWHFHLPIERSLLDSRATPFKLKRLCIETLVQQAYHLAANAPQEEETHIVAAIVLPELSDSQIIVFFGQDYFQQFFISEERSTDSNPAHFRLNMGKWSTTICRGLRRTAFYTPNITHE